MAGPSTRKTTSRLPRGEMCARSRVGTGYSRPLDDRIANGSNGTLSSRSRTSPIILLILHQKFSALHHLFAIEPDVEIAADTVDVRFGRPIGARVPGIGMTEGDVDTGNFFVLQNIADHVSARGICADCEFADAVAILVRAGVSAKFFQQFLVFAGKIDNAIVAHL